MLYMVDVVDVEPDKANAYISVFQVDMVPILERAGATFVHCMRTRGDIGQRVSVQTTLSFADLAAWNVVRKNLVLDQEWYACAERLRSMRDGGARRFYESAVPVDTGSR